MTRSRTFLLLLFPMFLVAGCGQKGPLYLPGHEPPSQRVSAPKKKAAPEQPQAPVPKAPD